MPDKMESIPNFISFPSFDKELSEKRKEVELSLIKLRTDIQKENEPKIIENDRLQGLCDLEKKRKEEDYLEPSYDEIEDEVKTMYNDFSVREKRRIESNINSRTSQDIHNYKFQNGISNYSNNTLKTKFVNNLWNKRSRTPEENGILKFLGNIFDISKYNAESLTYEVKEFCDNKAKNGIENYTENLDYTDIVNELFDYFQSVETDITNKELEFRKKHEDFYSKEFSEENKATKMKDYEQEIRRLLKIKRLNFGLKKIDVKYDKQKQKLESSTDIPRYDNCLINNSKLKLEFKNPDQRSSRSTRGSAGRMEETANGNLILNLEGTNSTIKKLELTDIEQVETRNGRKYIQEQFKVTEINEEGVEESYTILAPVNDSGVKGISIVCSETSTFFEFGKVNNLSSTVRKPIIAFEGFGNTNIKIEVN
jgi:hypothetical protein